MESINSIMPNEVTRMFFEHMSENQRMAISRVCRLWNYLVFSFPPESIISPVYEEENTKAIFSGLENDAFRALANFISENKKIRCISLKDSTLKELAFDHVLKALKIHKHVKSFIFNNCQIPLICVKNAMQITNNPNYIKFMFYGKFELNITDPILKVQTWLFACRFDKAISFQNQDITNAELGVIAAYLENDRRFEWINLKNNRIDDEGLSCLLEALKTNDTVKEINLKNNKITTAGIQAVEKFYKNRSVKISLGTSAFFKDELSISGVEQLNICIQREFIKNNTITLCPEQISIFANALAHSKLLNAINIKLSNDISNFHINCLKTAKKLNPNLKITIEI